MEGEAEVQKLMLIGEAWGAEEAAAQRPFVGPTGRLLRGLLRQSGISEADCYFTNVFNLQPKPSNNIRNLCGPRDAGIPGKPSLDRGQYALAKYAPELARLEREIHDVQPNLILAVGNTALWAIHGTTSIKKMRGTLSTSTRVRKDGLPFKTLSTYHPSFVIRQWSARPIVLADLDKARRQMEFPELVRPARELWLEPTLDDLALFEEKYLREPCTLSVDIETAAGQVTEIGFAPSESVALVVPFFSRTAPSGNYWSSAEEELLALEWCKRICESPHLRCGGQNFLYDIQYLYRTLNVRCPGRWDTMLAHHALQPEMEKSLGFLASIYTDEPAWKFMRKSATLKKED